MQHFDLSAHFDMRVAVPEQFLKDMRAAATAEDASEFLKVVQAAAEDDDEFVLMILRNGLKQCIRQKVLELMHTSGIGGSFQPVRVQHHSPLVTDAELIQEVQAPSSNPADFGSCSHPC